MLDIFGLLYVRDKENEPIRTTIEKGYNCYKDKYEDIPTIIECSLSDIQEEFEYLTAKVCPSKSFNKGVIWITGKKFENGNKQ